MIHLKFAKFMKLDNQKREKKRIQMKLNLYKHLKTQKQTTKIENFLIF